MGLSAFQASIGNEFPIRIFKTPLILKMPNASADQSNVIVLLDSTSPHMLFHEFFYTDQNEKAGKHLNENIADVYAMIKVAKLGKNTDRLVEDVLAFLTDLNDGVPRRFIVEHDTYESMKEANSLLSHIKRQNWPHVARTLYKLQENYDDVNTIIHADNPIFNGIAILKKLQKGGLNNLSDQDCRRLATAIALKHSLTPEQIKTRIKDPDFYRTAFTPR